MRILENLQAVERIPDHVTVAIRLEGQHSETNMQDDFEDGSIQATYAHEIVAGPRGKFRPVRPLFGQYLRFRDWMYNAFSFIDVYPTAWERPKCGGYNYRVNEELMWEVVPELVSVMEQVWAAHYDGDGGAFEEAKKDILGVGRSGW